jgi:dihydroorotate dehydrogenase
MPSTQAQLCHPFRLPFNLILSHQYGVRYETAIRPLLFSLDPETAHHCSIAFLRAAGRIPGGRCLLRAISGACNQPKTQPIQVANLTFKHPVGLAAGFDKNAVALRAWEALGFSFVEAGTVTAQAQPGNEKPRIFRLPEDQALINRLGFNNDGAETVGNRLDRLERSGRWPGIPVGLNIGKTKVTPLEQAAEDYVFSMKKLYPYADYFTINVSSPNTPGLRELQGKEPLTALLKHLRELNHDLAVKFSLDAPKAMFLKIAPDLTPAQLDEIVGVARDLRLTGIVATNTTTDKSALKDPVWQAEAGGLSGRPLAKRSTEFIRAISQRAGGRLAIIGVGGIFTADDLREKLDSGASLVQVYTGFIYRGPSMVRSLLAGKGA